MVEVVVRPVEPGDIEILAANMRQADIDEVGACGHSPIEALEYSVKASMHCWTATGDGELACMFGVTPISMLGGIGCPWMLGTELITQNAGAFIRHSRSYIQEMLQAYPHLFNFVDARNAKAIRWLKRAGFTLHDPVPHGPYGMLFHPFEMKA